MIRLVPSEQRQPMVEAYRHLIPAPANLPATSRHAKINLDIDLKRAFPGVLFTVQHQVRRSGASVLTVHWTAWPDDTPDEDEVQIVAQAWARGSRYALDMLASHEEEQARDLRHDVFGSAERVRIKPVAPTPEQWVRRERQALKAVLKALPPPPKDATNDARDARPVVRRPRL